MVQCRLDVPDALKNHARCCLSVARPIPGPWKPAGLFKHAQCLRRPPRYRQHFGQIDSKKARLGKLLKTCPQDYFGFRFQSHSEQNVLYLLIGLFAYRRQRQQFANLGNRLIELAIPKLRKARDRHKPVEQFGHQRSPKRLVLLCSSNCGRMIRAQRFLQHGLRLLVEFRRLGELLLVGVLRSAVLQRCGLSRVILPDSCPGGWRESQGNGAYEVTVHDGSWVQRCYQKTGKRDRRSWPGGGG